VTEATRALDPIGEEESIAVTICTKNRPGYLASLLASLVNQTYPHWSLVVNDQSASAVEENDAVKDLLQVIRTRGHGVKVFRSTDPRTRHQEAMDATRRDAELILRVDDDVLLTPTFVEEILRPYRFFPQRPLAAVGPCLADVRSRPLRLEPRLADPSWVPRVDRPTWRLQGHAYTSAEILEVESLFGSAICYRRSAVIAVGGWAVSGYSEQIYREESDMSARLLAAGYELMVTTAAVGWHLLAPSGGNRTYLKTPRGNVLVSDRRPFEEDDRLFRTRLAALLETAAGNLGHQRRRYRIAELAAGAAVARPLVTWRGRARRRAGQAVYRVLRPLRDAVRYVADRG
jgi:GT2 family glycosyltransferase